MKPKFALPRGSTSTKQPTVALLLALQFVACTSSDWASNLISTNRKPSDAGTPSQGGADGDAAPSGATAPADTAVPVAASDAGERLDASSGLAADSASDAGGRTTEMDARDAAQGPDESDEVADAGMSQPDANDASATGAAADDGNDAGSVAPTSGPDGAAPTVAVDAIEYLVATRTATPPPMTGDLAAWDIAQWVALDVSKFVEDAGPLPSGDGDLAARCALLWDEEALYLAVVVADDTHLNTHSTSIWKGDSLQLGIEDATLPNTAPDLELGWSLSNDTAIAYSWTPSDGDISDEAVFHIELGSGSTIYVAQIPAEQLPGGMTGVDDTLLISLVVNETDEDAVSREGYLKLTPGLGGTKNARDFLPLTFAQAP